jgi:hypothetical protein
MRFAVRAGVSRAHNRVKMFNSTAANEVSLRRKTPSTSSGTLIPRSIKTSRAAPYRMERDGGCVLREFHYDDLAECKGYTKAGILQGEHLIERSNSATFADPRLVACICKGHGKWSIQPAPRARHR